MLQNYLPSIQEFKFHKNQKSLELVKSMILSSYSSIAVFVLKLYV